MAGSGNPFIDAINSVPMPNISANTSVPDFSQMFQPHGVDLSNVDTSSPSEFHFTAAGFSPTASSSAALPSALKAASQQYSHPMGNLWSDIKGGAGAVYNDLRGGLRGAEVGAGNEWTGKGSIGWSSLPTGLWKGLRHPGQANQQYQQIKDEAARGGKNQLGGKVAGAVGNFAMDTVSDPLTYVPFGKVAKVVGLAKAAKIGADAVKGTNAGRQVANALNHVFKPIQGARSSFINSVGRYHGGTQSDVLLNNALIKSIFQGTSPEQQSAITHALESTTTGTKLNDPTLEKLRMQIAPLLENASEKALNEGHIGSMLNPADYGVGQYIPHVSVGKLDELAQPFSDLSTRKTAIDASKSRNLEGTIKAINDAAGKPVFEENMPKILAYHLNQLSKASRLKQLINEAMANGVEVGGDLKAGDIFPGTVQKAVEYSHDGKTVLLPESEARYLVGLTNPKSEAAQFINNVYRGSVNGLNRAMFLGSPFVHILNNLGTQSMLHDPGILKEMPKYLKEAFTGVQPGSKMDEALKNGALHLTSEIGHSTNAAKQANAIAKELAGGKSNAFLRALQAYNQSTPAFEKAYRTAAYDRAIRRGMTPEQATSWIRSIFGGSAAPDTASNFEKFISTTAMPFYNWTKTAIGSNVKNFLNNPAPYVAGYHALNDYNQAETGHGMLQNKNPLSIPLPWKDKNGNQEFYAPYAPPFDVGKLLKDIGKNGIRGPLDFAQSRFNPIAKYLTQISTGEQNPFASPLNKYNIDKNTALAQYGPQYNDTGILFGGKGPQAPAYLAQLMQDLPNPVAPFMEAAGQSPRDALLSQLLGGSVSAPNPQSTVKEQNFMNRLASQQFRSYLKGLAQKQNQGG